MYKIIANGSEDFLAIKFSDKVTSADYNALLPVLKDKLEKHKKINLYWELENFEGWDVGSLMQEIKFDLFHASQFNKIAIVGEHRWEKIIATLGNFLTQSEIKYFENNKQLEAMNWINSSPNTVNENVYKNNSLID